MSVVAELWHTLGCKRVRNDGQLTVLACTSTASRPNWRLGYNVNVTNVADVKQVVCDVGEDERSLGVSTDRVFHTGHLQQHSTSQLITATSDGCICTAQRRTTYQSCTLYDNAFINDLIYHKSAKCGVLKHSLHRHSKSSKYSHNQLLSVY